MPNLYHAQIGEGNLIALLRRAGPLIGEVNYPAIAGALRDAGYTGTVGLDVWASGEPVSALDRFSPRRHSGTIANP
jgi:hydroxypyruvate isomerase